MADVAFQGSTAPLPPAGDARRDELKRRHDALMAEAERLGAELQSEGIDPRALSIDPEVAQSAQDPDLAVAHPRPDYEYCWVYRDPFRKFGNRTYHTYQREGYERVSSADDDGRGMHPGAEGEIVNADCLLMRIRKDRKFLLEKHNRLVRRAREEGVTAELLAEAERRGANVTVGELPRSVASQITGSSASAMGSRRLKQAAARQMAMGRMDQHLRSGTMPGMQVRR